MDVSGTKILGRALQPRNEKFIARACVQVCSNRGFPRRRKEHPFPKGHWKSWRDQRWNRGKGVWESSARSQREVRDQETTIRAESWSLRVEWMVGTRSTVMDRRYSLNNQWIHQASAVIRVCLRPLVITTFIIRPIIAISGPIPQTVLVGILTVNLLPFHLPFPVLELRDGYPSLVRTSCWLEVRQIFIG